jgi:ABC-type sugar transport system permease subunit
MGAALAVIMFLLLVTASTVYFGLFREEEAVS